MTIPVPARSTSARASSAAAGFRRLRDPALTVAAFGVVLAVVFGFGPFQQPAATTISASAQAVGGASTGGQHLAGLSR